MRHVLIALFLLLPGLATAQSVQDQIVSQLTAQGFTRIEVSRTLLGRVKIEARSATLERELVFNPVTGEILRDYWEDRDDGSAAAPRVLIPRVGDDDDRPTTSAAASAGRGSGSGNSGGSSGSSRDDDRADDDRSGSGNGGGSSRSDDRDDDDSAEDDRAADDRDDDRDDDSGRGRGRGRGGDDDRGDDGDDD